MDLGNDPLLTPAEVARIFNVRAKTVTRWAIAGKLPGQRTPGGRDWRFRKSVVEQALNTSHEEGETDGDS